MCTYSVAAEKSRKAERDDVLEAVKFPHAVGFARRKDGTSCATCIETGTTLLMHWAGKTRTCTFREEDAYEARRDWLDFHGLESLSVQDVPLGTVASIVALPEEEDLAATEKTAELVVEPPRVPASRQLVAAE